MKRNWCSVIYGFCHRIASFMNPWNQNRVSSLVDDAHIIEENINSIFESGNKNKKRVINFEQSVTKFDFVVPHIYACSATPESLLLPDITILSKSESPPKKIAPREEIILAKIISPIETLKKPGECKQIQTLPNKICLDSHTSDTLDEKTAHQIINIQNCINTSNALRSESPLNESSISSDTSALNPISLVDNDIQIANIYFEKQKRKILDTKNSIDRAFELNSSLIEKEFGQPHDLDSEKSEISP